MPGPELAPTFAIARNPEPDSSLPYLLRLPSPTGRSSSKPRRPGPARPRCTATAPKPGPSTPRWWRRCRCGPAAAGGWPSTWCWTGPGRTAPSWSSPGSKAAGRRSSGNRPAPRPRPGLASGSRPGGHRAWPSCPSWSTPGNATPTVSPASRPAPSAGPCPPATTAWPSTATWWPWSSARAWPIWPPASWTATSPTPWPSSPPWTGPPWWSRTATPPSSSSTTSPPASSADLLAAVQVRYPQVPIVFCDTRTLAEEWTYRFLGAALAFAQAQHDAEEEDPR